MGTKTELEWLDNMGQAFDEIDAWEKWAERAHHVQKPSDLARDNKLCPEFPTSRTAVFGIASAVDHLGLFRDAVKQTRTTRPFAYYSLARAAVFASLRSVWILCPQYRRIRQERGLWVEYDNLSKFIVLLSSLHEPQEAEAIESLNEVLADAKRRRQVVIDAGARIGATINKRNKPTDTKILEEATAWIDRHAQSGEFGPGNGMMVLWRIHSGAAHSLPWIHHGKAEVVGPLPSGGYEGRVSASIEDMGTAVASATIATREAMELLHKRSAQKPRK